MSQQCAVTISNFNVVHFIRLLQLKICEVDVDDVAFGNLDGFSLVKVVGEVGREIRRSHHSTHWSKGSPVLLAKHLKETYILV